MVGNKRRQLLLDSAFKQQNTHGGELSIGKRKNARPISTKKPMHITMRASVAKGRYSLLTKENAIKIKAILQALTKKWNVRVYEWANSGNHLHMLIRAKTRGDFKGFLRSLSGAIAMAVTGARKGKPFGKKFWDLVAFSRIVEWGRAFIVAKKYVVQNRLEASGVIPYQARKKKPLLV